MLAGNPTDDDKSRFVFRPCRNLQQIRVFPEQLRIGEVDAVLIEVSHAFLWVELECHNGIENIPFLEERKYVIYRICLEIRTSRTGRNCANAPTRFLTVQSCANAHVFVAMIAFLEPNKISEKSRKPAKGLLRHNGLLCVGSRRLALFAVRENATVKSIFGLASVLTLIPQVNRLYQEKGSP